MVGEVNREPVETVGNRRAGWTTGIVVGTEHEVIDQKLRTAFEKIRKGYFAVIGPEMIRLVDADPGQFLPLLGHLVAAESQLLLGFEQLRSGREPFIA